MQNFENLNLNQQIANDQFNQSITAGQNQFLNHDNAQNMYNQQKTNFHTMES